MSDGIDYEAEYNNRARVPEHPEIIAGWARDAAAYREAVGARFESRAYGPSERQRMDLFRPEGEARGALVVYIHGGYWQAQDRPSFSHMARGLNAHGIAVAVPGYDLCPQVRVGDIVEEMRAACRSLAGEAPRLVVTGNSAGGHLTACMAATDWRAVDAALPPDFVRAAYAISGIFDLKPLLRTYVNQATRMDAAEAERLSPLFWPPPVGRTFDAVVGAEESAEYLRQSRTIVDAWGAAGVRTRYEAIPGANHFTVIAPLADPHSGMTRRLAELALAAPR
jgi:arylformamidase